MALSMDSFTGSNFSYQHLPFTRFLDDMVELDRRAVELWGIAPEFHIPELGADDLHRVATLLHERGLSVACITPEQVVYPVNIASPSPWLRRRSIDMFRRSAEVAAELGSPLLFLTPGRGFEDEPIADAWQRSAEALQEIAAYAATLGVRCLLEPLQRVESNLVNDSAATARMLADVGDPTLGVALDTVAMAVAGETVADYLSAFGDRILHVHLIDGTPAGHLAWGDGGLPLDEYLRALDVGGYAGHITFELFGDGSYALDPRTPLESCLRQAREVLAGSASV